MREGDRLAEVLAAISLAASHARGQAAESILGTTILATRMGRMSGLSPEEMTDTFYAAVSRALGCTSTAMDSARLAYGNDLTFSFSLNLSDFSDPQTIALNLDQYWALEADPEAKANGIAQVMELLPQMAEVPLAHGQQAVALARRLPVSAGVSSMLSQVDARWDGMNPFRPGGEDIPPGLRIIEFALVAEMYRRAGGLEAMHELASSRSGGQFDPAVCTMFSQHSGELLAGFEAHTLWDLFLDTEPEPKLYLEEPHIRPVAEVSADFADNKSGWTVGHSRIVADAAVGAARSLGLSIADQDEVFLAGLMHDLGRCAVPNGVWDKPGELSPGERRLAESHSRYTEEILDSCDALRANASLAGAAHERLDGSGYHHGTKSQEFKAQLLAVADMYAALVQDRSWREALTEGDAAEVLLQEADGGRLSSQAVAAVLESQGHRVALADRAERVGLTPREVEVLQHLAQGLLTKQIAAKLGMAHKTADNHIQNIYKKIGASSRTAAAMYAVEHGIYSA